MFTEAKRAKFLSHLDREVVKGIRGFSLEAYLVALEGWRRGLELKWYKNETELCKLDRVRSSTQGKFFSLANNKKLHYFFRSRGDMVSNEAVEICRNKQLTKEYLKKAGIPVPEGAVFDNINEDKIISYTKKLGFPVVVKPLTGSMGKGVYVNINNEAELLRVLGELNSSNINDQLLVEKHYPGKEYRVYVVGDDVAGAVNRIPANIIGDGVSTVSELIEQKNKMRKKNPYLARKPINIDFEVCNMLQKVGYDENSILKRGEQIFLREKSNLSSGGDSIEATDDLSEEVKSTAIKALKALPDIPHAGVDIIVNPTNNDDAVVLEINATAEIALHVYPVYGEAKDIPAKIIDYYFPETTDNQKSNAYFDFKSVLEPLKTWATEEIKISKTPSDRYYVKKYYVTGKVHKVGYMTFIQRKALRLGLFGEAKKSGEGVEVTVIGTEPEILEQFKEICYKGSRRSKVEEITETQTEIMKGPFQIGFKKIL